MSDMAQNLLDSLFSLIAADAMMQDLFHPQAGPRAQLPRLSFDEIQTQPFGDTDYAHTHKVSFSLWTDLHARDEAMHYAQALRDLFAGEISITDGQIIWFRAAQDMSAPDHGARLWRVRVNFEALTETLISV